MNVSSTQNKTNVIRYGHTPDPDDAFMFYGFHTGAVKIQNFEIEHVLDDIETLNQRALRGEIEITAVSAAIYPRIAQTYWILPMGASVGRNYGPVVAHLKDKKPKGKKIGIPGLHTTAALLLQLYSPGYDAVPFRFDRIPDALQKGDIDYGLLIHEAQMTYDRLGLQKVMDLGEMWTADTALPLPLGLDVVRKDLGRDLSLEIARALKASIELARSDRRPAVQYAQTFGRGLSAELTDRFVGMYVNDDTVDMGADGEKALNVLFDKAYRAGLLKAPVPVEILRGD